MPLSEVTDADLLAQLNGSTSQPSAVTDPKLLAQLEAQQPAAAPNIQQPARYTITGAQTPNPYPQSPVWGDIRNIAADLPVGIGKLYTDWLLAGKQIGAQLTGSNPSAVTTPFTGDTSEEKRQRDVPIGATPGGLMGEVLGAAPLAAIPGANTYLGAAAIGGGLGAFQPTTPEDSRLLNTGAGTAFGVAGKYTGDTLSNWLTGRAAQPFMGWNQKTGNKAAAGAVGSDADALNQDAIRAATQRFNGIFGAARSPNVNVPLGNPTGNAVANISRTLSQSPRAAFEGNSELNDLLDYATSSGTATAEQLGSISSKLGKEASSQMSAKRGDRDLGRALFSLKDHVDDLVGNSITDPALSLAYDAARPQYRTFLTLTGRPTLLNSSTGDVNLRNLGNYLQRNDKTGYMGGANTSRLYQAARYGQATGLGSRPPPPIMQPFKWAAYHAVNNPVVGATGGAISLARAPIAPALRTLGPRAPVLLPGLLNSQQQ